MFLYHGAPTECGNVSQWCTAGMVETLGLGNVYYRYRQYQYIPLYFITDFVSPVCMQSLLSLYFNILMHMLSVKMCHSGVLLTLGGGELWGIMFIIDSTYISASHIFDYGLHIPSLNPIPSITMSLHCRSSTECGNVPQWRTAETGGKLWG